MTNQPKISNQVYRHSQYELEQGENYGKTTEQGYQIIDREINESILPKLQSLPKGSIVIIAQVSRPSRPSNEPILAKKYNGLIRTKQAQVRVWQRLKEQIPEANLIDIENFKGKRGEDGKNTKPQPILDALQSISDNELNVVFVPIYGAGLAPQSFLTPRHSAYRNNVLHDPLLGEELEAERYLHLVGFEKNVEDPTIRPERAGAEVLYEIYRGMAKAQKISRNNNISPLAHNPEIHFITIGHAVVSDSAIALFIQECLLSEGQNVTLGEIFDSQMSKKMIQHFEGYEFTLNDDSISLVYRQKTYNLPLERFLKLLKRNLLTQRESLSPSNN